MECRETRRNPGDPASVDSLGDEEDDGHQECSEEYRHGTSGDIQLGDQERERGDEEGIQGREHELGAFVSLADVSVPLQEILGDARVLGALILDHCRVGL